MNSFRAWDGNVMHTTLPLSQIHLSNNLDLLDFFNNSLFKGWIFMQKSKSTDLNGNLIYVGDIVEAPFRTGSKGLPSTKSKLFRTTVVFYDRSGFCLKMPKNYKQHRFIPDLGECKIIGNIYENPELLENENI